MAVSQQQYRLRRAAAWMAMMAAWTGAHGQAAVPVASAAAPAAPAAAPAAPDAQVQQVVVSSSAISERRTATAAKLVLGREDLARFGDTSVADVLRRVPGITVSGGGGQAREIRLRGMGSGYTQILLNGDPVAQGFSLDSIAPDLIERIEVLRSATADMSTQSIAGTINIILKRTARAGQRDLKLGASVYEGLGSANGTFQYGERSDQLAYSLAASAAYERNRWPSTIDLAARRSDGTPLFGRHTDSVEQGRKYTLGLTPRLTWNAGAQRTLALDGLLQAERYDYSGREVRTTLFGSEPVFPSNTMRVVNDSLQARAGLHWKAPLGEAGKIDLKSTLSLNRRDSDGVLDGFDRAALAMLYRTVDSRLTDSSVGLTGKYALPMAEGHSFGAGWDGQYGRRAEDRIQRERSEVGFPTLDLDEDYRATVSRLALYVQHEWSGSAGLSAYGGLRWEALHTDTAGAALAPVQHHASVLSPTAQLTWKIPGTKSDQLRAGLARTYKAPTARELIPRRWVINDNSATSPNFQGNPGLLPELSWGLDLGYERYLPGDAFLGVNAYARQIDEVILQRIFLEDGVWISTPTNSGKARVLGLELEAKGKLHKLVAAAPKVDLRAGLTRNWSRVDQVPGPGNRLSQQPQLTASIGADYALPAKPLTMGAAFTHERGGYLRSSLAQSSISAHKQVLDVYGLWTIDKRSRVRVTLSNLTERAKQVNSYHTDAVLVQEQTLSAPSYRTLRVLLDMKL